MVGSGLNVAGFTKCEITIRFEKKVTLFRVKIFGYQIGMMSDKYFILRFESNSLNLFS